MKTCRDQQQDEQICYISNGKYEEKNEIDDYNTITVDEAARLLNISPTTVNFWSDIGLLPTSTSPAKGKVARRMDILTFLAEENRAVFFRKQKMNDPSKVGAMRQERQKLAEMNVRAITKLTKQSVYKISHLGGSHMARIGK